MVTSEQLTTNRREEAVAQDPWATPGPLAERAARHALKAQVARLERELSAIVAGGFPHIAPASDGLAPTRRGVASDPLIRAACGGRPRGPHLLTLAELERLRDRLATRVREAQGLTRKRDASERRARELLERMQATPSNYKFVRLPVVEDVPAPRTGPLQPGADHPVPGGSLALKIAAFQHGEGLLGP